MDQQRRIAVKHLSNNCSTAHAMALKTLLFVTCYTGAYSHGYLSKPVARTGNHNGLNGGWQGHWCAGRNGKGAIRATYTGGQVVEFQHVITAHHFGHLEMTICNTTVGNNCANAVKMIRAEPPVDCVPNDSRTDCKPIDVRHPERFYLPPRRNLPQTDKFRYIVPYGLSCGSCTLQWRWWTANSAVGADDYGCYWDQIDAAGWNSNRFHGYFSGHPCGSQQARNVEQFTGCSDITVLPGGPTPAPQPTPAPPPTTTPQPTPAPPPPSTPAPTPAPGPCRHQTDCDVSAWCNVPSYEQWCQQQGASGQCPSPHCTTVEAAAAAEKATSFLNVFRR